MSRSEGLEIFSSSEISNRQMFIEYVTIDNVAIREMNEVSVWLLFQCRRDMCGISHIDSHLFLHGIRTYALL